MTSVLSLESKMSASRQLKKLLRLVIGNKLVCLIALIVLIYIWYMQQQISDTDKTVESDQQKLTHGKHPAHPQVLPGGQQDHDINGIAPQTDQKFIDYLASSLGVNYTVLGYQEGTHCKTRLVFTNKGSQAVGRGRWTLLIAQMLQLNPGENVKQGITIADDQLHLQSVHGDLYTLKPTAKFRTLAPGQSVSMVLRARPHPMARSDQNPNWMVICPGLQPRVLKSTQDDNLAFVTDYTEPRQWKTSGKDLFNPFTPEDRFARYKLQNEVDKSNFSVIPTPLELKITSSESSVLINKDWVVIYEDDMKSEAAFIGETLGLKQKQGDDVTKNSISLSWSEDLASEEYTVEVSPKEASIIIEGGSRAAVFYGIQSLLSLLASTGEGHRPLPSIYISDKPRFPHRGVMLDLSRNFLPLGAVKKLVDVMAMYKLNKLHLHLTDDQGWRLQIPGLPELTELGARRGLDLEEKEMLLPYLGAGPFGNTSGSGFFTVDNYKDLLKYAAARHVVVIPEIDMPAHMHAAIKAMEARRRKILAAGGSKEDAEMYLLSDPDDTSTFRSPQGFTDNAMNPCMPSTFTFIKHVMSSLVDMHKDIQPLQTFHFGGDEVPRGTYSASPICAAYRKKHPNLNFSFEMTRDFLLRLSVLAASYKLELHGWEDGFKAGEGNIVRVGDLKTSVKVAYAWIPNSFQAYRLANAGYKRGIFAHDAPKHLPPQVPPLATSPSATSGGAGLAGEDAPKEHFAFMKNAGYIVVMGHATHLYFDQPQEPDPESWGLTWATRYADVMKTYMYNADDMYDTMDRDLSRTGHSLTKDLKCPSVTHCPDLVKPQNIIGLQGNLWTETVRSVERAHDMLFPRTLALAERSWHRGELWEDQPSDPGADAARQKSWEKFARQLTVKELPRLEKMGVAYNVPPPGVRVKGGRTEVNTEFPGMPVQFDCDKQDWAHWSATKRPSGRCHFRSKSLDGGRFSRTVVVDI